MAAVEAILFDLDGTLVDEGSSWHRAVSATIDSIVGWHLHTDPKKLESEYYKVSGEVWNTIKDVRSRPWGNMDDEGVVRQVWGKTLERLGVTNDEIIDRAMSTYYHHRRNSGAPPFDDVVACLEHLQVVYQLGVITNGLANVQQPKIESAGLGGYFRAVVTTDIGFGKPQVEIFDYALRALNTGPARAVYVGDSLSWDVGGANTAGMVSVWLNRRGVQRVSGDPIPNAEISSLRELPEAVDRLCPGDLR